MKKIISFIFFFLLNFNIFGNNVETDFLDKKTVSVRLLLTLDEQPNCLKDNSNSEEILKNRKRRKAKIAAFLGVFAKLLTSVVNIINGNPKDVVANIVGSVITAAAQATQVQSDCEEEIDRSEISDESINKLIINTSETLYAILKNNIEKGFDLSQTPLLKEFSLIESQIERSSWIANNFLDNFFVQAFLKDAIKYLNYYLHARVDGFTSYLEDNLLI